MTQTREVMVPALTNWKDLTYQQIDKIYGERAYLALMMTVDAKATDQNVAMDNLMNKLVEMAQNMQTIRARVAATPDPV